MSFEGAEAVAEEVEGVAKAFGVEVAWGGGIPADRFEVFGAGAVDPGVNSIYSRGGGHGGWVRGRQKRGVRSSVFARVFARQK